MLNKIKDIDAFTKNTIIVFLGTSLFSFLNLLCQVLIAHKLSASDFAAFNSLLSIFMLISAPLVTLQIAIAKYSAEFSAKGEILKVKFLLSNFFIKTFLCAIVTFLIFCFAANFIIKGLQITSVSSGYILAILLALAWITPVFMGGLQGLELFKWFVVSLLIIGILKLLLAFVFILLGYNIAGALGAFLVSGLVGLAISYFPLRNYISLKVMPDEISYEEILLYLFPVAISSLCFMGLVNLDMVLVKYFFIPEESGSYSLAQMVGKIFLFLPAAVSLVMFPAVSRLKAKNLDTNATLRKSLLYGIVLCIATSLIYNLFPGFILNILTGKIFFESIVLGRLFSVSMSFFALLSILITYFLSIKDLRFIKYLVLFTMLQFLAIVFYHTTLFGVQLVLCINAILLFSIHLMLLYRKRQASTGTIPVY